MAFAAARRKQQRMGTRSRFVFWLMPAALWLWLFYHLHDEWTLNPQYFYGWAVPFLATFLFYLRWIDRPASLDSKNIASLQIFLLLLLLPLRLVEEANPDWRAVSWTLGLAAVAYSLVAFTQIGGKSWARHFAFPVCFTLVAIPWPVQFENLVIQGLTRAVAFAAVEIAGWLDIGALQIGNIIELPTGFVGVSEACSGVKTLQAAIMVALALGELFSLTMARRFLLLVAGCAWVFFCNVLRASTLVFIAARQGTGALEHWHDLIGSLVLVVGMAGLLAIAWILKSEHPHRRPTTRTVPGMPEGGYLSLAWIVVVFGATEIWYRSHEKHLLELPAWEARRPNESKPQEIPDATRTILHYNRAQSAAWEEPPGIRWWIFFARWEPQRAALQLVRSHSPEICLPAVGRIFRAEREPVTIETRALPLRFRVYEFEQNGQPLFVFVCIQEDKIAAAGPGNLPNEWSARGRLLAVWHGQRNLGQRLLEIAVSGFDDFSRAREALEITVREVVQPMG